MAEPNIELRGLLKTLNMKLGFALRPRLSNLTISALVADAYGKTSYEIPVTQDICEHQHPNAMQVAETLRSTLMEFFEHEIAEAIVVEGFRPFDPHAGQFHRDGIRAKLEKIVY